MTPLPGPHPHASLSFQQQNELLRKLSEERSVRRFHRLGTDRHTASASPPTPLQKSEDGNVVQILGKSSISSSDGWFQGTILGFYTQRNSMDNWNQ